MLQEADEDKTVLEKKLEILKKNMTQVENEIFDLNETIDSVIDSYVRFYRISPTNRPLTEKDRLELFVWDKDLKFQCKKYETLCNKLQDRRDLFKFFLEKMLGVVLLLRYGVDREF